MAEILETVLRLKDNYTAIMKKTLKITKDQEKESKRLQKEVDQTGKASAKAADTATKGMQNTQKQIKQTTKEIEQQKKAYNDTAKEADKFYRDARGRLRDQRGRFVPDGGASGGVGGAGGAGSGSFGGFSLAGAASFAAAGYAAKKAWDGAMGAINLSAMQKVQETTFQALLNHKEAGSALYDYVSAYAKVSALGREDLANAVTAYSTYTKDADQIERLIKLTERLYAKDPTQGAQGAAFAMKELLSGDTMSIKDRFNMSGFSGAKIRDFANSGDIEGMLDYVDEMFNRFGATQEVVDANYDNLITQTNIFSSNLKTAIAESATPAMEKLAGVMRKLNADMDAGKYQPFINLMANGMQLIGNGIAWVAENINWLAPAVVGVTTAFLIYKGTQLAVAATTAIVSAATNLMTGNLLGAASAALALVGGLAAVNAVSKNIDVKTDLDVESAKAKFAAFSDELSTGNAKMPVEVSNSAPIKVKGEVEIEEESMRYMLDIQGKQWLAKFTTATIAPQNVFNGTVIRETADFDEFTQTTIDSLRTAIEVTAAQ